MLLRALGMLGRAGAKAGWAVGSRAVPAAAGLGYGAAMGAGGLALGAGYLGYRAVRGGGDAFKTYGKNPVPQIRLPIQARMMGAALGGGATYGMYTRDPGYRSDFSPGGNLEVKAPAMLDATGDLALSLNRNARNVPSPTQYGYMATTNIPASGRF